MMPTARMTPAPKALAKNSQLLRDMPARLWRKRSTRGSTMPSEEQVRTTKKVTTRRLKLAPKSGLASPPHAADASGAAAGTEAAWLPVTEAMAVKLMFQWEAAGGHRGETLRAHARHAPCVLPRCNFCRLS